MSKHPDAFVFSTEQDIEDVFRLRYLENAELSITYEPTPVIRRRGRPRKDRPVTRRPARKRTEYNDYVRVTMEKLKRDHPNLTNQQRMKVCADMWNEI